MICNVSGITAATGLNALVRAAAAGIALAALTQSAAADTMTYVGPTGNAVWNDAGNWDAAGVPGAGDTALFTSNTTFTSFDGQSIGVMDAAGQMLVFGAGHTLTMDNGALTSSITARDFRVNSGAVIEFGDELIITATTEMTTASGATFRGDTLVVNAQSFGWKASGVILEINRLDLSGTTRFRSTSPEQNLPDLAGITVDLGSSAVFRLDWPNEGSLSGLNGSHLEMDASYSIFLSVLEARGENIQLASWTVGSTVLPAGIYNNESAAIGDADFATIFGNTSMSFTVIPEPASFALLAAGGLLVVPRRARRV